ncbi:MAG TPA: alpha/beta fold hydrolase [Capillimicrobium sp.]|jgi:pimeloyl-ACP methyl ester carboxylesterase
MLARRLAPLIAAAAALVAAPPALAAKDCPRGYRCTTVTVPLDRSGAMPGTLRLPVVAERSRQPLLLVLAGGPGQGAAAIADAILPFFERIAPGYRLATFDQRGTGATALRCPALQRAALTDLTVPPPGSVQACARRLGPQRALYTTSASVEDLDAVRARLGAERTAISGTSYGTYVAERYARAHPDRVSRLVLDSVVPQENVDPLFAASMRRASVVLRELCADGACRPFTRAPVADLRRLVERVERRPIPVTVELDGRRLRAAIDGPALFDLSISLSSFFQRNLIDLVRGTSEALEDRPGALRKLYRSVRQLQLATPSQLSWGLHTATLCEDLTLPWGTAASPAEGRRAAVDAAVGAAPRGHFGVFGPSTAARNGALVTCERWAPVAVPPTPAPGPLPDVPILALAGTWDLSTPVEDARREVARTPGAQLMVIPEGGHSTLTALACARTAARRFLRGRPTGDPCRGHRVERPGGAAPG